MASAQSLAEGDEERKPKLTVENGEKKKSKELFCESNFEDKGLYEDKSSGRGDASDQEVDVVGFAEGEDLEREMGEDPDATEQSSSFGNTFSGSDDEVRMSDVEVNSQFSVDKGEQPVSDGIDRLFKKKKVTAHWRNFISPLMWRCKWLELRMNELRSQAILYDKKLAAYKREKQLQPKMVRLDDSVSKSVPLAFQSHRRAMKRRKRKRREDTVNISSYMSSHSIFSYYENKKAETDGQSVGDACEDQVDYAMKDNNDHAWSVLGVRGADHSLEQILFKIESLQSRVCDVKAQLNKVDWKTLKDITSTAGNFLQGQPPSSHVQSNNGDEMARHDEDKSTVSSYSEADVDMIESTAGLLAADAPPNGYHIYSDIAAEDVLINNQAADEDLKNFDKVSCERKKLQEMPKEETESCSEDGNSAPKTTAHSALASVSVASTAGASGGRPVLKPCYTGKKRGRKPKRKSRGGSLAGFNSERLLRRKLN